MSNQSTLDAMLAQYATNNAPKVVFESAFKFDEKNYFGTFLEAKEKSAMKTVRILPTADGSSPIVEISGHKIKVDGKQTTFICPKHEKGLDCPFCEAREQLLASGKEQDKELAKNYSVKKMYVVKVIDRDNEADGPKFWRFNHDYRKTGTFDKIYGVIVAVKKDITHAETGRDLVINIARDQNDFPVVQSIVHADPTPLSEDKELAAKWLADDRTWEAAYVVKSYDYLEIVVKGGIPVWDKVNKKFVDKASQTNDTTDADSEITLGTPNVKAAITVAATEDVTAAPVVASEPEDDLPF